jgi:hypothetical protein
MLGGLGAKVMDMDAAVRQAMAVRARAVRQQEMAAYMGDLRDRMGSQQPEVDSVAKSIANRIGGSSESYRTVLEQQGDGADAAREALYRRAAARKGERGPLSEAYNLMSQDGVAGRAMQAGVYGAAGGGVTLGLTAAGQGLMALMQYLQQGGESQQERQAPLA